MPVSLWIGAFYSPEYSTAPLRLTPGQALELPVLQSGTSGAKLDVETSVTELVGTFMWA